MPSPLKPRATFGPLFVRLVDDFRPSPSRRVKFRPSISSPKNKAKPCRAQKTRPARVSNTRNGIHEVRSSILLGSTIQKPRFLGGFFKSVFSARCLKCKNATSGPLLKLESCPAGESFRNNRVFSEVYRHRSFMRPAEDAGQFQQQHERQKMMLINKRAVADLARAVDPKKRSRVSAEFFNAIDAAVRKAVADRLNHHDNRAGTRKTIL